MVLINSPFPSINRSFLSLYHQPREIPVWTSKSNKKPHNANSKPAETHCPSSVNPHTQYDAQLFKYVAQTFKNKPITKVTKSSLKSVE